MNKQTKPTIEEARAILKRVFGYDDFRSKQEEVIAALLAGKSVLALMPTGGGKSLCYQIPALMLDGTVLVISPLIALMKDQVDALRQYDIRAAYLNSTLSAAASRQVREDLAAGNLDLLYIAPERLMMEETLAMIKTLPISLVAVDEAHCISQWGHDFRPDYMGLGALAIHFPNTPILATTATADMKTRADIVAALKLNNPHVAVDSFDRPNIFYAIRDKKNVKAEFLKWYRANHQGDAGIIYCLSHGDCEENAAWLQDELQSDSIRVLPYHAGLPDKTRAQTQQIFTREEGVIVCATIAFGMGINKPDVRFVAHFKLPPSLESYYQETGRAGRDGAPANALLFYGLGDVNWIHQTIEDSDAPDDIKRARYQKFKELLIFCDSTICRRYSLLKYFDEDYAPPCGACDNCKTPPATYDGKQDAQKFLSAIKRLALKNQKYGVNHIVDIVTGKETDKVMNLRHNELKTFGAGADKPASGWRSIARQMIAAEYVSVEPEFSTLVLNDTSEAILAGNMPVRFKRPTKAEKATKRSAPKAAGADESQLDESQRALYESLKAERLRLSRAQDIPPYVIFHNSTLLAMAQRTPTTRDALSQLPGMGANKLDRYGDDFLKIIQQHGNDSVR